MKPYTNILIAFCLVVMTATNLLAQDGSIQPDQGASEAFSNITERLKALEELEETISVTSQVRDGVITIIAIVSAIMAIFGFGMYGAVKSFFERKVIGPAMGSIDEKVELAKVETIVWSFNEFSFTWWVMYEGVFQEFLNGKDLDGKDKEDALNAIGNAIHAAKRGVKAVELLWMRDKLSREKVLKEKMICRCYIHLLNQLVYSSAAKTIVSGKRESEDFICDLNERCREALKISTKSHVGYLGEDFKWYEVMESVGTYKFYVGRMYDKKDMQDEGRRILMDLIERKPPSVELKAPPKSWADSVKAEHGGVGRLHID